MEEELKGNVWKRHSINFKEVLVNLNMFKLYKGMYGDNIFLHLLYYR